jgi:hypothetical protein
LHKSPRKPGSLSPAEYAPVTPVNTVELSQTDLAGTPSQMRAFAEAWASNPELVGITRQLIFSDAGGPFNENNTIFGGKTGAAGIRKHPRSGDVGCFVEHPGRVEGFPALGAQSSVVEYQRAHIPAEWLLQLGGMAGCGWIGNRRWTLYGTRIDAQLHAQQVGRGRAEPLEWENPRGRYNQGGHRTQTVRSSPSTCRWRRWPASSLCPTVASTTSRSARFVVDSCQPPINFCHRN